MENSRVFYRDNGKVKVVVTGSSYAYYCNGCGTRIDEDGLNNVKEDGYYTKTIKGNCNGCNTKLEYTS